MTDKTAQRHFTGWHMTAILVAFFATVVTVNFAMARLALSTFGGTVVDNSYVASQHYNEWLARAATQDRLGWDKTITLDAGRHVHIRIIHDGMALDGLGVRATRNHPLGRVDPAPLHFVAAGAGALRSVEALPAGRWRLDLTVRHAADEALYRVDVQ